MPQDEQFTAGPSNRSMPDATVIPILHYPDVPAAAEWLCRVFGFSERLRIADHRVQLSVGRGAVVVARGGAQASGTASPASSVMVRVSNVDLHCKLANEAGATILSSPTSQPYGERQYSAADPAGHVWTFSQTEADVEPGEWGGMLVQATHVPR